jgi:hypothetical protein
MLTATILQNNQPIAGTQVRFDIISGPHDGTSGSITTDYSGKSTFSYTGTAAGIDTIIASIDTDGDGEYDAARQATVEWKKSSTVNVKIDIKPISEPNSINCQNQNGVITVAILTTDTFDATTVDHTTVLFEGAEETHIDKQTSLPRRHEEDVDNDGDLDLVFHFRYADTNLRCDSTEGMLTGNTTSGNSIQGIDSVRMVQQD